MATSTKKTSPKNAARKAPQKIAAETMSINDSSFANDSDNSITELFLSELKDMYWAENHLVKSIPAMIEAATDTALKSALEEHLEVTRTQVARIEEIFDLLGEKILAKKCDAMEGLIMSGEHTIENTIAQTTIRDTGIISSGLKVENFEITCYKGMITLATKMGNHEVVDLLQQSMQEEQEASDLLTGLAQQQLQNQ